MLPAPLVVKGKILPEHEPSFPRWLGIPCADSSLNLTFGSSSIEHFLAGVGTEINGFKDVYQLAYLHAPGFVLPMPKIHTTPRVERA
jgi:hypothetical protein